MLLKWARDRHAEAEQLCQEFAAVLLFDAVTRLKSIQAALN
jgi:hypothetical protein